MLHKSVGASASKRKLLFFGLNVAWKKIGVKKMKSTKKEAIFWPNTESRKKKLCAEKDEFPKKEPILFRTNIVNEKFGLKKNYEFQKKEFILFGQNIALKMHHTVRATHLHIAPKKSMSSKKKELILFQATPCAQKKYEFQKKRNSYFFRPRIAPKKSMSSKKKGTHTF